MSLADNNWWKVAQKEGSGWDTATSASLYFESADIPNLVPVYSSQFAVGTDAHQEMNVNADNSTFDGVWRDGAQDGEANERRAAQGGWRAVDSSAPTRLEGATRIYKCARGAGPGLL